MGNIRSRAHKKVGAFLAIVTIASLPNASIANPTIPSATPEEWGDLSLPQGFFNVKTLPTEPIPLKRAQTEWDPCAVVLINVPIRETLQSQRRSRFYKELIETIAQHAPVWIGYDNQEAQLLPRLFTMLGHEPGQSASSQRLSFLETGVGTAFIRESGPFFGEDLEGNSVAIDPIYRRLEANASESTVFTETQDGLNAFLIYAKNDRNTDSSPLHIARLMRSVLDQPTETVRPPLFLRGGDLLFDAVGHAFLSGEVVMENGGSPRSVRKQLKDYFGAKQTYILESYPQSRLANLAAHFRILKTGAFLLSQPPPIPTQSNEATLRFHALSKEVYQANLAQLSKAFPERRIISLPSLSIGGANHGLAMQEIREDILKDVCSIVGVNYELYKNLSQTDKNKALVDDLIAKKLAELARKPVSLSSEQDLDLLQQALFGESLEAIYFRKVTRQLKPRRYTDFLGFSDASGKPVFIFPKHASQKGETQEQIEAIDREVEQLILGEQPDASVHWIEVEEEMGALLRRVALPIPTLQTTRDR